MEREILFRGKRIDNGEWVYGYLVMDIAPCSLKAAGKCVCKHDGSYAEIFAWEDAFHEYNLFEVDPATRGQYTGLTDKNGVKIFDGDILHFINTYRNANNEWLCAVEFLKGAFICRYIEKEGHLGEYHHFDSWNYPLVQWDVVGNIHDNPELLEVQNEAD